MMAFNFIDYLGRIYNYDPVILDHNTRDRLIIMDFFPSSALWPFFKYIKLYVSTMEVFLKFVKKSPLIGNSAIVYLFK